MYRNYLVVIPKTQYLVQFRLTEVQCISIRMIRWYKLALFLYKLVYTL